MNAAHLHLILVHIPIVLVPLAVLLLAIGIAQKSSTLRTTAYSIFAAAAAVAGIAFQLGEGAEELVEHLAGVSESVIEDHEEAAEAALWAIVILGVGSIAALFAHARQLAFASRLHLPFLCLGLVTSLLLAIAAQQGGKIRHPEAFEPAVAGSSAEKREREHDEH